MGGFPVPTGQLPRGHFLKSHLRWLSGVLTSAPSLSTAGFGDPVWMVMPQIPMVLLPSFLFISDSELGNRDSLSPRGGFVLSLQADDTCRNSDK